MGFFAAIRKRIAEIRRAPLTLAERAAPRIQAQLIADATTRRGNVPSFLPGGPDIPIRVTAEGEGVRVQAAPWVLALAEKKGQHAKWGAIVNEEAKKL